MRGELYNIYMKKHTYVLLILISAAIISVSIYTLKRYAAYKSSVFNLQKPPAIVLSMKNVYIVGIGNKGKIWSVKAKNVDIGQNRSRAEIIKLTNGQIYNNNKPILKIKAGKAICDTYRKDLQLSNGIFIEGMDGQKISGEGALWNSASSTLRSIGKVKFQDKIGNINTDNLVVNIKSKEMDMQNVNMQIYVDQLDNQ